jgi:hypothetical protein
VPFSGSVPRPYILIAVQVRSRCYGEAAACVVEASELL